MNNLLNEYLSEIELGEPQQFKNLVVVPIFTSRSSGPEYLTLGEALTGQLASITELHSAGSVPQMKVTNLAEALLLLVDGEELIGARQNRTLNTSILVRGRRNLSCRSVAGKRAGALDIASAIVKLVPDWPSGWIYRASSLSSTTSTLAPRRCASSSALAIGADVKEYDCR